jgi:hypothetical protein
MNASPIAYLALLLVIPLTVVAFATLRPAAAAAAVVIAGAAFLPEQVAFDAPLVPPLDKHTLPALCAFCGALLSQKKRVSIPSTLRYKILLAMTWVGAAGTVWTNPNVLIYDDTVLQGLGTHDLLAYLVRSVIELFVPFTLGRLLFRSLEDARDLLRVFVTVGVLYTPFIFVELWMSPQWHRWIYGYHQHDFGQTLRGGGYRPMCFMAHGLALALFMFSSMVAAWTLTRSRVSIFGVQPRPIAWGLTVLFPLLKSLGAVVYGLIAVPLTWFARPRTQLRVAAIIAALVFVYPVLRCTGWFPTEILLDLSAQASQDRARSLEFRFNNEEELIARALEQPVFGWGGYGRNLIYNDDGRTFSVVDGAWIIFFGSDGFWGLATMFTLLLLPIAEAFRASRRLGEDEQRVLAGVALILTFSCLDLLPNGLYTKLPIFLAGAIASLARGLAIAGKTRSLPELLTRLRLLEQLTLGARRAKTP